MIKEGEIRFIGVVEETGELSKVRIFPEFCPGLQRLNDFSHIIILYWFHLRDNENERRTLKVIPRRHPGAPQVGVFASRSPSRPNPIGLCVTELVKIEECALTVRGLDALQNSPIIDVKTKLKMGKSVKSPCAEGCTLIVRGLDALEGSPIVDIKPYIPKADSVSDARVPEWALRGPPK